jgi:penicillin-binding protein 2
MIAPKPDHDDSSVTLVPSARSNRSRILKLTMLGAAGLTYLLLGLVYRQLIQGDLFTNQHERQIRHAIIIPGTRGRIYDRNGYILADNRVRMSVNIDLGKLRGPILREQRRLNLQAKASNPSVKPDLEALLNQARLNIVQGLLDKVNRALSTRQKPVNLQVNAKSLACAITPRANLLHIFLVMYANTKVLKTPMELPVRHKKQRTYAPNWVISITSA